MATQYQPTERRYKEHIPTGDIYMSVLGKKDIRNLRTGGHLSIIEVLCLGLNNFKVLDNNSVAILEQHFAQSSPSRTPEEKPSLLEQISPKGFNALQTVIGKAIHVAETEGNFM